MPVLVAGLSHRQVAADGLACFAECAADAADALLRDFGMRGMIALSTCNRFELYLDADRHHPTARVLQALLADSPAADLAQRMYVHSKGDAVQHLLRVTCGLDSMVLGESEIVGQVRSALADQGADASPRLRRLFQMALATSKAVTNGTGLRSLGRSVASVALDLCERRHGPLTGRAVILLGTGAYAGVVTADLLSRGAVVEVFSASGRAEAFAKTHRVLAPGPDELAARLGQAAAVIACSGNGGRLLAVDGLLAARRDSRGVLPVVDLARGRDVDPALAALPTVVDLIDLDVIGALAPRDLDDEPARARALVREATATFLAMERGRRADPAVTAMRAHVEEIVAREVATVSAQQPAEVAEAVTRSLRRVANALLHTPSSRAAESAAAGELEDYASALETIFGLRVEV